MNSISIIRPYKHGGIWMFDDPVAGLVREPFVSGADEIIDLCVLEQRIVNAERGHTLFFSEGVFPNWQYRFDHVRSANGGNWYRCNHFNGREGWLCPALFKYFEQVPQAIYAMFQEKI